jgi:hypothetical protein
VLEPTDPLAKGRRVFYAGMAALADAIAAAALTTHPTAEWLARQIVEAFPWDTAPPKVRSRTK